MLARLRAVSAAAHGTDAQGRRIRGDYDDAGYVIVYGYDLPGPGFAGDLLRLSRGVERIGGALAKVRDAPEDEPMPLGDKVVVAIDVVVGVTNIVVGACDVVVGTCDFVEYARGALARFRGKPSGGGSTTSTGRRNNVIARGIRSFRKRICGKGKNDLHFEDLPEDVVGIIFSKLELKETVRTSVLSSKWRDMWMKCPKLRFDGSKTCGKYMGARDQTPKFVDNVNQVLKLQRGKVVEALEIKIEMDSILVNHLDNWVRFATASGTKNLALDLEPKNYMQHIKRYIFPLELLDGETMSRLQQIQLSYVSFKLPSQFNGFRKLKRLDLRSLHVSRNDLQDILSGCSNLEWLSIERCDLKDEIIVDRPLSHLQYLRVANCDMTKIELHAMNLRTFIYKGSHLTVQATQAQQLKVADINLSEHTTLEHALTVLPKVLTGVESLILHATLGLHSPTLLETRWKFFQLKHLKLVLFHPPEDLDNTLSLASFLRAAPLIEELEIRFCIYGHENAELRNLRNLPKYPYKHLRNICIAGFEGIKGQAESLVHAVENAPALEVLTIHTAKRTGDRLSQSVEHQGLGAIVTSFLEGKISPKTKLQITSG